MDARPADSGSTGGAHTSLRGPRPGTPGPLASPVSQCVPPSPEPKTWVRRRNHKSQICPAKHQTISGAVRQLSQGGFFPLQTKNFRDLVHNTHTQTQTTGTPTPTRFVGCPESPKGPRAGFPCTSTDRRTSLPGHLPGAALCLTPLSTPNSLPVNLPCGFLSVQSGGVTP